MQSVSPAIRSIGVIGGGISGSAFAQLLKQKLKHLNLAEVQVTIFERDADPSSRDQGFYISISENGLKALNLIREELPSLDRLFNNHGNYVQSVVVADSSLSELLRLELPSPPTYDSSKPPVSSERILVNRRALRSSLAEGLDIQWNKKFLRYEEEEEEGIGRKVKVFFEDGSQVKVDLLLGADGARSKVRAQRCPEIQHDDLQISSVGGVVEVDRRRMKTSSSGFTSWIPLSPPDFFPGDLVQGSVARSLGEGGHTMLLLPITEPLDQFSIPPSPSTKVINQEGEEEEEVALKLLWMMSYPGQQEEYSRFVLTEGEKEDEYGGPSKGEQLREELKQVLLEKARTYFNHPIILKIIQETLTSTYIGPRQIYCTNLKSIQGDPLAAGRPSRVVLLGDAAHAMTTHRGNGANTALLDSVDLSEALVRVLTGKESLEGALEKFEIEMMKRGRTAVEESVNGMTRMHFFKYTGLRNWGLWTIGRAFNLYRALFTKQS